jgi:hypothetical protein
LPEPGDLFRHQLGERNEIDQHLAYGEVGGRLFFGERPVHGVNKELLDLGAGESIGGIAQLREVKLPGIPAVLGDLDLPDRLALLPVRQIDEEVG